MPAARETALMDVDWALAGVKEDDIVDLASQLIRIPSFTRSETDVARWLESYFGSRGYEVQLDEVEDGRFQTVAVLKGSGGGRTLMFNGHVDIDPLAVGWRRPAWTPSREGNRLYGAGAYNMKGGVAAMIAAAEAIRGAGVRLRGDLVIACVAGELEGGVGTVHLLERGWRADMAVVPEPNGAENIVTTHTGVTQMAISTVGYSQHTSCTEGSIDALKAMLKVMHALETVRFRCRPRADLPDLPRLSIGSIIGGRGREHSFSPNYTCDYCTVLVDIRFLPGQTAKMIEDDIREQLEVLKAQYSDLRYEIEHPPSARYGVFRMAMEPLDVPHSEYIVESVVRNYEKISGKAPKTVGALLPGSYTGNDTAHLWRAGIPCVLFGPDGGAGTVQESDQYVRIDEMVLCARVLALTALDVCNVGREAVSGATA